MLMTFAVSSIFLLLAYTAVRLSQDYMAKSLVSYGHAERTWAEVNKLARELLAQDVSPNVAKSVIALAHLTGCGCFVRGVLLQHYFPSLVSKPSAPQRTAAAMNEVDALNSQTRELFGKFLAVVIANDSFRNPLQGLLFRRVLQSYATPKQGFRERREAELTAFSVLNRKNTKLAI
jgi:hypothetical protein